MKGGSIDFCGRKYFGKSINFNTGKDLAGALTFHSAFPELAAEPVGIFVPDNHLAPANVFFADATDFVNLQEYLVSLGGLPENMRQTRLVKLAKIAGHAVGCAHTLQSHGDLKPENILVRHSRTLMPSAAKIVDWEYSARKRRNKWHGSSMGAQQEGEGNLFSDLRRLNVYTAAYSSYPVRKAFLKAYYAARRGRLTKKTEHLIERIAGKHIRLP